MRGRARIAVAAGGALLAAALLVLFALYNQGNPIVLRFGFATWSGEAVYALYAAAAAGLVAMFLAGLPADLRARRGISRSRPDRTAAPPEPLPPPGA